MSPGELAKVVDWIEDRWPGTKAWRYADKIANDFIALPETAVWEAARNYYNAGHRTAPTPAETREAALRIARGAGTFDPQATDCNVRGHHGPLAIELVGKEGEDKREAMCVDCGTIRYGTSRQFPTVGEREAREKGGLGPDAPEDTIADRIAP